MAWEALTTSNDVHAAGVARLVAGDTLVALGDLRGAAVESKDADVWNDYAAACITRADEIDDPTFAIDALAASDRALEIAPHHGAAHFNRALALSRLGLLIEAAAEWQTAVQCDPGSAWADEAIRHLHDCPRNETSGWTTNMPVLQAAIVAGDVSHVRALIRRYPQQARTWAESICLMNWADAVLTGRRGEAENQLRMASATGDALREVSGEAMVADAAAAVVRSMERGTEKIMAQAYVLYRQGRIAHAGHDPTTAETRLREAKALFAQAGSPMARVAAYYIGSALHAQSRTDEAAGTLNELAAGHPEAAGYRALASQIGWERGLCALDRGAISDAIDIFTRSHDLSARAGEEDLAASMDALLASAYDAAGDQLAAWQTRRRAFETLSRMRNVEKTLTILDSAALLYVQHHQCDRAAALLNLINNRAERTANALVAAHALTQLALADLECGNNRRAAEHLADVPRWIRAMKDERTRERAEADLAYADALIHRGQGEADIGRLDRALDFFRQAGIAAEMPRIYLERAKVAGSLGRLNEARENAQAGITIVESERLSLRDFGQRASLLLLCDDLFEEAIELALQANDEQAAFHWVERARGRALLDMFSAQTPRGEATPLPLAAIQQEIAPHAAILEYVALKERLTLFAIRHDRFRCITVPIRRERLSAMATAFRRSLAGNDPRILEKAAQLHSLLVKPLLPDLEGAHTIAVVSDRALSGVPFTALYDPGSGRFLSETAAVIETPSAAFAITASQRAGDVAADPLLAIAATTFDSSRYPAARALPSALEEASAAASRYPGSRTLSGPDATRSGITTLLEHFRSVHFAGHAIIGRGGSADSALLVAPANDDRGELLASDIAKLRLPRTALVVLAACRSANPPSRGDGVENLADAFLAAGVPTVVASAFDLDDTVSARIMGTFHKLVARGTEPSEAVRLSIGDEVRDAGGKIRLPMDWANITVLGGARALTARKQGPG